MILEVRRSEEAEGERRMIGSGRERFLSEEPRGPLLLSAVEGAGEAEMVESALGRGRLRPRNISAVLRMYEKSCVRRLSWFRKREMHEGGKGDSYDWFDPAKNAVPITHSSFSIVDFLQTGINCFSRLRPWRGARKCCCTPHSSRSQL